MTVLLGFGIESVFNVADDQSEFQHCLNAAFCYDALTESQCWSHGTMTTLQIRMTISPEVNDYVEDLGLRAELEEILAKIPEMFPNLIRIECEFDPGIEDESDPVVAIWVALPDQGPNYPTPRMRFSEWEISRFPGQVLQHFSVLFWHEAVENART
jgi:hypothetical protein